MSSNNNINQIFDGTMTFSCGSAATNVIYNLYGENLTAYIKSSSDYSNANSALIKQGCNPSSDLTISTKYSITTAQINQLIANSKNLKNVWNSPGGAFVLANLGTSDFVSACLYGTIGKVTSANQAASYKSFVNKIKSNMAEIENSAIFNGEKLPLQFPQTIDDAMTILNNGRFCTYITYNTETYGIIKQYVDFSRVINSNSSTNVFSIILSNCNTPGNLNNIYMDNANIILTIIAIFGLVGDGSELSQTDNFINSFQQGTCGIYNQSFNSLIQYTVSIFESSSSHKSQSDNIKKSSSTIPTINSSALISRPQTSVMPGLQDSSVGSDGLIQISGNTSQIFVNSFTEPPTNSVLSILDIIRNNNQYSALNEGPDITIASQNNVSLNVVSSNDLNVLVSGTSILTSDQKNEMIKSLQAKLSQNIKELNYLQIQLQKSSQNVFSRMGASLAGIGATPVQPVN